MKILRTRHELRAFVKNVREEGRLIGLVPTMGALHEGHLSLMNKAVGDGLAVVASVFVNPTQFNNPTDLATYPRDEEADFRLLERARVDAVFAPSVEEIYPTEGEPVRNDFQLGSVAEVMEGARRPGHFQGVAQIVNLLFSLATPDKAYFGEKDFQQIAVIKKMVETEHLDVEIISCPICRAPNGLALSSRNMLLTENQRKMAPGIYKALCDGVDYAKSHTVNETINKVCECINALPECQVEYFEIVEPSTLQSITSWDQAPHGAHGCITVYCGKVRLIDNIAFNTQK